MKRHYQTVIHRVPVLSEHPRTEEGKEELKVVPVAILHQSED